MEDNLEKNEEKLEFSIKKDKLKIKDYLFMSAFSILFGATVLSFLYKGHIFNYIISRNSNEKPYREKLYKKENISALEDIITKEYKEFKNNKEDESIIKPKIKDKDIKYGEDYLGTFIYFEKQEINDYIDKEIIEGERIFFDVLMPKLYEFLDSNRRVTPPFIKYSLTDPHSTTNASYFAGFVEVYFSPGDDDRYDVASALLHEYVHHLQHCFYTIDESIILREGHARGTSTEIIKKVFEETNNPYYLSGFELEVELEELKAVYLKLCNKFNIEPKEVIEKLEFNHKRQYLFNLPFVKVLGHHSEGSALLEIMEQKYGKEVYKDILEGNSSCFNTP